MHPLPSLRRVDLRLDIPLPTYSDLTHLTQPCFPTSYVPTQAPTPSPKHANRDPSNIHSPTQITPSSPIQTLFEQFYNMSRPCSPTSLKSSYPLPFSLPSTPFAPILNEILQTPTSTYLYSPAPSPTSAYTPVPSKKNLSRSFSHPHRQPQATTKIHRSSSFNTSRSSRTRPTDLPSTLPTHPHPQPKEQQEEHTISQSPSVMWTPTLPFSIEPCSMITS
jgi:hypothetical protein